MRNLEEIRKTPNLFIEAETEDDGMGGRYYDRITEKFLNFIFSYQMGWEHLSVSTPSKCPTWEQMCRMKDIFWSEEETCIQYHPAKSQYVDNHPYCLHIWKPIESDNFTVEYGEEENILPIPPHLLVGFKNEEEKKEFLELADKFEIKINQWKYNQRK